MSVCSVFCDCAFLPLAIFIGYSMSFAILVGVVALARSALLVMLCGSCVVFPDVPVCGVGC